MTYYRIKYEDGTIVLAEAEKGIEIIRKYDLASRANASAKISELDQEQYIIESLELEVAV